MYMKSCICPYKGTYLPRSLTCVCEKIHSKSDRQGLSRIPRNERSKDPRVHTSTGLIGGYVFLTRDAAQANEKSGEFLGVVGFRVDKGWLPEVPAGEGRSLELRSGTRNCIAGKPCV